MSLKATSDLWWKNAVIYCLDVETFYDSDGDGCGDLRGLTERTRLPRRHRRLVRVADALLRLAASRRRLRHLRLLRRRSAPGHPRRPRGARSHGARPRHPRDRRPRGQPHLRSAPVVPGGARRPRLAVSRLLRLVGREARGEARRRGLPRQGGLQLGVGRAGRPVLPPPLLLAPARPQRGQPGGARRDRAGHGLLDRAGPVGFPHRRRAVPARADGHARGRARRPARAAARPARVHRAAKRRGHAARRGEPRAGRGAQVLRRRGRRRAAHAVRLRRHAGHVPGARPRRRQSRCGRRCSRRRRSRPTASGGASCATTTS